MKPSDIYKSTDKLHISYNGAFKYGYRCGYVNDQQNPFKNPFKRLLFWLGWQKGITTALNSRKGKR